jgi:hypothetical protein
METQHIFLDTEVFIRQNFDFESRTFTRLIELVEQEKIIVHLTSITVSEIEKHIVSLINEGISHLKAVGKKPAIWVVARLRTSPFQIIPRRFDVEPLKEEGISVFRRFLERTRANIIPVEGLSIDDIFAKYFESIPPFGSAEKKNEFPDAFAVAGVQRWCDENEEKMFVISKDGDMKQACELSEELLSLQSVDELFDLIAQDDAELYAYALRVYAQYKQEILGELKERFAELWFFLDEVESEVSDVEVKDIDVLEELAIEVKEDHATFKLIANVTYTADISYAEMITEDVPVSWVEGEIEETERIHAEVSILYDREDPDASQVDSVTINEDTIMVGTEPEPWELK